MPGRKYGTLGRYGFNGKENDKDIDGNCYDYGFRIYNPALGKFLSVDPLTKDYSELTPYQFSSNTPLQAIDLDGLEAAFVNNNTGQKVTGPLSTYSYPSSQGWIYSGLVKPALSFPTGNTSLAIPIKEREILMSNGLGTCHIGPESVVLENVKISRQNYFNSVLSNIAGGPFGALGYWVGGENGTFSGAAVDGVITSFGGIAGETTVGVPNYKSNTLYNSSSTIVNSIASFEHPPINIGIKENKSWTAEEVNTAYNKAQTMSDNPNTKVTLKNPEERIPNTRGNFIKNGGSVSKKEHVDHVTELQLNGYNGANGKTNLAPLSGRVNTSFGSQVYSQIKNLPENTQVKKVCIIPASFKF